MKRAFIILSVISMSLRLWSADNWPQFRGPGGLSLATQGEYPLHFGPGSNVLWKVELPSGNSSPCVWGDRIFLTAVNQDKLETLCLDRRDGAILWRKPASAEKLEPTHRLGSPATPTPSTDGERVYVSFGSYGVIAYDFQGNEVWKHPLPQPIIEFGTSSSPVVADGLVILNCDQDVGSMLRAFDARTGKIVWETSRDFFLRGFATPLVWRHDEVTELVVPGSVVLTSYGLKDGKERWSYRGTSRVACASPVVGDGLLFSSSWNVGGDEGERVSMPKFDEVVSEYDKNKDGKFTLDELPPGPVRERFSQIDVNKDGVVTQAEWDSMAANFARAENAVLAIKPGGHGDITASHLVWKESKQLPYVSSPLYYDGRLYTVRSGGLVSCYDAKTGRPHYQGERLGAAGDYYSSAVGASGRVYFISQAGVVTVVEAGDELKILASHPLNEGVMATPAFLDGKIYLRTANRLYAFGR